MFSKLTKLFEGKKTYFVALAGAVLGLLDAYGVKIPEYVYILLGALGLATTRSAISKTGPQ